MNLFYKRNKYIKKSKGKVGDIMTSLKTANRRVGSLFAVAALVLATITPGLVPAFASAAQLTERSVTLSSSSKGAEDVTYAIKFTPVAGAAAVVLNFCSNTPLLGTACTAPAGFNASDAEADGFTVARTTASAAADPVENNAIVLTGTIAAEETEIVLEGVNNPSAAGSLYVRIVTYSNATNAAAYVPATLGSNVVDQGTAAMSITDTVGVSGAVLESLTFCVSGEEIESVDCTGTTTPTVKLGVTNGDVTALSASVVSEGSIYSQISTNAASGAVVNLKSSAAGCGGLLRSGAPDECDIKPASAGITTNNALFGIKVIGATTNTSGAFTIPSGAIYDALAFKMNFDEEEELGVTSPYGDPVLDTAGAPANAKNAQITFGASISNNTPAGLYSADFSLIATGKF